MLLQKRGAAVSYHDPHIPRFPRMRKHSITLSSQPLTRATPAAADCVLIITNHSTYDYDFIVRHSQCVLDTRNATRGVTADRERIRRL